MFWEGTQGTHDKANRGRSTTGNYIAASCTQIAQSPKFTRTFMFNCWHICD